MRTSVRREKVRFDSGGAHCAAWHYPSTNGACVVMAGGFGVTKEPGTDRFAERFARAGFGVLAFDYRHLGESGGHPRQVARVGEHLADWRAAIGLARSLPDVDPGAVAAWGFSLSGGHLLHVAARDPALAAVIAQTPGLGGWAASRSVTRHQTRAALLRLVARGVADAAGAVAGRAPRTVPLAVPPGTVGVLSTPDSLDGARALDPDGRYGGWRQEIAARSALRFALYQPGRAAPRVRCPVLVVVCEQDTAAYPPAAIRAAHRMPRGELVRVPGAHYAPFLEQHERVVEAELEFLNRHLPGTARASDAAR